jgi:hypothetical protein
MSVNLLTVPNTYDLFCGSLTITNEASGLSEQVVVGRKIIDTNVPILLAGNSTSRVITGYAIRGAISSTFPAVFPSIEYEVLENDNVSVVNVKIPRLTILTASGGGNRPSIIQFRIPRELSPSFSTSVGLYIETNQPLTIGFDSGLIIVTSQFSPNYIQLMLTDDGEVAVSTYGDTNYGMIADIDFSYIM